jgi:ABC-type branched-subunit amino acid transport system substrate-binding protein
MRADRLGPRILLPFGVLVAGLVTTASGCGGGKAGVIRIGVLSDCESSFASGYEATIAGAELPLILRGAALRGPNPSDGVKGASVAGKPVELVVRCVREFSRASTLAALRLLVERDRVDVVVGPNGPADGLVVRDYAKRRPGITFVYSGFDGAVTLNDAAPNVFRYRVTMAQWGAGLGWYAYRRLGWRHAVTIGNIEPGPAGFIAEFCSLGGKIARRLWLDGGDLGALVAKIPKTGVDGVFLPTSLFSYDTESFVAAWADRHPDLAQWLVAGDGIVTVGLGAKDKRLLGVVASNPTPWSATHAWATYSAELRRAFPRGKADPIVALDFFDSVEPAVEALEQVHGDLSRGERRLMDALARLKFDSPEGPRRLDSNHQAIGVIYLGKMVRDEKGKLTVRTIRVVPNVDQSFGGYFSGTTAVSRTQPSCKRGHVPSWAR